MMQALRLLSRRGYGVPQGALQPRFFHAYEASKQVDWRVAA